jgi:hypothetical protein
LSGNHAKMCVHSFRRQRCCKHGAARARTVRDTLCGNDAPEA